LTQTHHWTWTPAGWKGIRHPNSSQPFRECMGLGHGMCFES
jgi:hypothetical protein